MGNTRYFACSLLPAIIQTVTCFFEVNNLFTGSKKSVGIGPKNMKILQIRKLKIWFSPVWH
jgi:hypothetical protein